MDGLSLKSEQDYFYLVKNFIRLAKKEKMHTYKVFFANYDDSEEIPLFSRYKHVQFLDRFSLEEKNAILLYFSIKKLDTIRYIAKRNLKKTDFLNFFSCITLFYDDLTEGGLFEPNFYVTKKKSCEGDFKGDLSKNNTYEEKFISNIIENMGFDWATVLSQPVWDYRRICIV